MISAFWIQPRNAWWWFALLVTTISPLVGLVLTGLPFIAIDPMASLASVALFAAFMAFGWVVFAKSPYAPDHPFLLVWVALAWGAFASLGLTLLFSFGVTYLSTLVHTDIFTASFGGAFPEEPVKLLGVVVIFFLARNWMWHPAHFLIVGMAVGFGFDIVENMLYGAAGALMDTNADLPTVLTSWGLRLLVGSLAHMIWTGIAAYGLGLFLLDGRTRGLGWLAFAIAVHFLFNTAWPYDDLVGAYLAQPVEIGVLVGLWVLSASTLISIWRRLRTPYRTAQDQHAALAAGHSRADFPPNQSVLGPEQGYTSDGPVYSDPN